MPTDAIRSIEEPFDGYETKVVFQDGYPQLVCGMCGQCP
jgi:hypothetical protein